MKKIKLNTVACALLAAFGPSFPARADSGAEHPAELRAAEVVDLFYNLDFKRASAATAELQKKYPHHPAGFFYESVSLYQQLLLRPKHRDALFARFDTAIAQTLKTADAYKSTHRATGFYYSGAAHGFRARAKIALGKRISAVRSARRGAKAMRKAVELDPGFTDALLGIGMYNYYLARVPTAVKPLAALAVGMWGNREQGLKQLHRVARDGRAAKMEARSALAGIYASKKEANYEKSLPLLEELENRYPRNPVYRLRKILVLERMAQWKEAFAAADPSGEWTRAIPDDLRPTVEAVALYRRAECAVMMSNWKEAAAALKLLEGLPAPADLGTWISRRLKEVEAKDSPPSDKLWSFRWPLTGAPQ